MLTNSKPLGYSICQLPKLRRRYRSSLIEGRCHPDFKFFPNFFSEGEQKIFLASALRKLSETQHHPRRRNRLKENPTVSHGSIQDVFLAEESYRFEEVDPFVWSIPQLTPSSKEHFDSVIRSFRETHISSWPIGEMDGLSQILHRLGSICPTKDTQTHILHLSSKGEILPHVDNVEASGSWILGVSLGAERIMRMESRDKSDTFSVLLPSGSVYLQRDLVRYRYLHSIERQGYLNGKKISGGQRVSVMMRDRVHAL